MGRDGTARAPLAGRVVRPEKDGRSKVIATRGKRWSDRSEKVFLETLAATCNVRLSAAEAGFSTTAVYGRRARWPAFREAWDAAIEHGYARIEAQLVERATDSVVRVELDGDWAPSGPPLSVAEMMNLLKIHRAQARGGPPQDYAWRQQPWDMDAIRKAILRKIEAIERARKLPATPPHPADRAEAAGDAAGDAVGDAAGVVEGACRPAPAARARSRAKAAEAGAGRAGRGKAGKGR
jgi:hypothetical protein